MLVFHRTPQKRPLPLLVFPFFCHRSRRCGCYHPQLVFCRCGCSFKAADAGVITCIGKISLETYYLLRQTQGIAKRVFPPLLVFPFFEVKSPPGAAVAGVITRNSFNTSKPRTKIPIISLLPGYANYTHQMQFFGYEEGRARAIRPTPQRTAAITVAYDYMLKDHLGTPHGRGV